MLNTISVVGESASRTPLPAIFAAVVMHIVGLALLVYAPAFRAHIVRSSAKSHDG